jgi:BirA family biotin operon repressor/biotin-[acetyl-CoA-carboxylase] ligase
MTDSTQDLAFAGSLADAPNLAVFAAEEQRAGRGRRSAGWHAPAGSSLLFTVLLRPAPRTGLRGIFSLASALAVCRAVEQVSGLRPEIKWPNDLIAGGRKLGGVLVEVRDGCAALGIGINVVQQEADFGAELRGRATSIAVETGRPVDRRELLRAALIELGTLMVRGATEAAALREEILLRLAWRGEAVRVGSRRGVLVGIDDAGRLLLEEAGGRYALASGSPEPAGR